LAGLEMNRVAIYCNTSHPRPLTIPGNEAVVHFHTNEAVNDAGFQLSYSSIEGNFSWNCTKRAALMSYLHCVESLSHLVELGVKVFSTWV